jgi:hypothetical protein
MFDQVPWHRTFAEDLKKDANQLYVEGKLKSSAVPLLWLFFLHYSTNRYEKLRTKAKTQFEERTYTRVIVSLAGC